MEPATFRSAVKRSTDWANPAAVSKNPTRFGFHSLNRRRNLTPVSNVCKTAVRSLFWTPKGFNELPEVFFEFPFNMIGELTMASLTGQSWRVLKSWYGRPRTKNLGVVSQKFLAGVWLRYVCNAGYVFIAGTLFGAVVHHSRKKTLLKQHFSNLYQKLFNACIHQCISRPDLGAQRWIWLILNNELNIRCSGKTTTWY